MPDQKLAVVTTSPLRDGWERDFLLQRLMSEGIRPDQITFLSLLAGRPGGGLLSSVSPSMREEGKSNVLVALSSLRPQVTLALGDFALSCLTGKSGIDKWQASVLWTGERKVIPCYPMERVTADLTLQVWISLCARKAKKELATHDYALPAKTFLLNPPLEETLEFLASIPPDAELSVDIETGRGQINTVGFAVSPERAIAINVLPDRLGAEGHYRLWTAIAALLESDRPKILQNFIYEAAFLSRYGIRLANVKHDTMVAQKFLWPELDCGLDVIGRMYTDMPYWKEDGKSWNNIRDWEAHYDYNCKDTTGTFAGAIGQRHDLKERGLGELFDRYVARLYDACAEMCAMGIPVSAARFDLLSREVRASFDGELAGLNGLPGAERLNPKSPEQVKRFLEGRGYAIPKKYDSKTKSWKPSTDEKSLKKLKLRAPDDPALTHLLKLSKLGKALSSYLSFKPDHDGRMRYSLRIGATETQRWAGGLDPWDGGVNPQTVPGGNKGINIKSVFEAPEGHEFLEIDLRQAESRFVAYDSADFNLITCLEDPKRDVHWETACQILEAMGKPVPEKKSQDGKFWRQLGKKSGHGANYSMKEATFIDSCLGEMDIVLTKPDATKILEAYHQLFPGIRRWHQQIREELCQKRKLTTPFGWERYFYARMNDDAFRQAYAFRPQSTIPFVMNNLMLHLMKLRDEGCLNFKLLLQCHDSILLQVPLGHSQEIVSRAEKLDDWHPIIDLAGGRLRIPTESKAGRNWGELKLVEGIGSRGEAESKASKEESPRTQAQISEDHSLGAAAQ